MDRKTIIIIGIVSLLALGVFAYFRAKKNNLNLDEKSDKDDKVDLISNLNVGFSQKNIADEIKKETKKSEIIVKNINYAKGLALKIHKLNGLPFLNNQKKAEKDELESELASLGYYESNGRVLKL